MREPMKKKYWKSQPEVLSEILEGGLHLFKSQPSFDS